MGFIDLEKICDGVNREALLQVLRVYDVGVNYWVELRGRVVILTVVYCLEIWSLSAWERRKIEVCEMMFEKHMWYKVSGQSEKHNNKRSAGVS